MRRMALIAALMGTCAVTAAPVQYEPIMSENDVTRIIYGLPEDVEVEIIPTRLGFCGDTATVVMDDNGFYISCGEYTLMAPRLGGHSCFGNRLERRIMLTDIVDKWTDVNCDGVIEMFQFGRSGISVSYLDLSTIQMIEGMGMRAEGQMVENAEKFIEAANMYALLLIDMDKPRAEELFEMYKARQTPEEIDCEDSL